MVNYQNCDEEMRLLRQRIHELESELYQQKLMSIFDKTRLEIVIKQADLDRQDYETRINNLLQNLNQIENKPLEIESEAT